MSITASITLLSACTFASQVAGPVTFTETLLDAPGPKGPLKGTLLTPNSKPTAVVLIVPGSGPTDRDGNNPLGVNASLTDFLLKAWPQRFYNASYRQTWNVRQRKGRRGCQCGDDC